jgi:hypothetical protein
MTDFPSVRDILAVVTPREPLTIFALRSAEKHLTEAEGRAYPNPDVVIDLARSVLAWRQFVKQVARGYRSYIEDYMHDLGTRALIDGIVALIPDDFSADFRAEVRVLVAKIDRRFRKSTDPIATPLYNVDEGDAHLDVYYRIPRPLFEPLRTNLINAGYISADWP